MDEGDEIIHGRVGYCVRGSVEFMERKVLLPDKWSERFGSGVTHCFPQKESHGCACWTSKSLFSWNTYQTAFKYYFYIFSSINPSILVVIPLLAYFCTNRLINKNSRYSDLQSWRSIYCAEVTFSMGINAMEFNQIP